MSLNPCLTTQLLDLFSTNLTVNSRFNINQKIIKILTTAVNVERYYDDKSFLKMMKLFAMGEMVMQPFTIANFPEKIWITNLRKEQWKQLLTKWKTNWKLVNASKFSEEEYRIFKVLKYLQFGSEEDYFYFFEEYCQEFITLMDRLQEKMKPELFTELVTKFSDLKKPYRFAHKKRLFNAETDQQWVLLKADFEKFKNSSHKRLSYEERRKGSEDSYSDGEEEELVPEKKINQILKKKLNKLRQVKFFNSDFLLNFIEAECNLLSSFYIMIQMFKMEKWFIEEPPKLKNPYPLILTKEEIAKALQSLILLWLNCFCKQHNESVSMETKSGELYNGLKLIYNVKPLSDENMKRITNRIKDFDKEALWNASLYLSNELKDANFKDEKQKSNMDSICRVNLNKLNLNYSIKLDTVNEVESILIPLTGHFNLVPVRKIWSRLLKIIFVPKNKFISTVSLTNYLWKSQDANYISGEIEPLEEIDDHRIWEIIYLNEVNDDFTLFEDFGSSIVKYLCDQEKKNWIPSIFMLLKYIHRYSSHFTVAGPCPGEVLLIICLIAKMDLCFPDGLQFFLNFDFLNQESYDQKINAYLPHPEYVFKSPAFEYLKNIAKANVSLSNFI